MNVAKYSLLPSLAQSPGGGTLFRVYALRSFAEVRAGDFGGYVESHHNLSHHGDCWIFDDAMALQKARVFGNARLFKHSIARHDAIVCDDAVLDDTAIIEADAKAGGSARLIGTAKLGGSRALMAGTITHGEHIGLASRIARIGHWPEPL